MTALCAPAVPGVVDRTWRSSVVRPVADAGLEAAGRAAQPRDHVGVRGRVSATLARQAPARALDGIVGAVLVAVGARLALLHR